MSGSPIRIAVIGDSSSSGIGSGGVTYPACLARMTGEKVRVENYAVPGFTSSDAAWLFHEVVSLQRPDFLVLYLGNNEGSRSPWKGRYRPLVHRLKYGSGKTSLGLPDFYEPQTGLFEQLSTPVQVANTPETFRANMDAILRRARQKGISVILVNPTAHQAYPPDGGNPLALYCLVVGYPARLTGMLNPSGTGPKALVEGLRAWEEGEMDAARSIFQKAIEEIDPVGMVALNNLAVITGESDPKQAIEMLKGFPHGSPIQPILTFNRAAWLMALGAVDEAEGYSRLALEQDYSLYRVKSAYRRELEVLARKHDPLYIDLETLLDAESFIDYCHPSPAGHEQLAREIIRLAGLPEERCDAVPELKLVSPNSFFHPGELLSTYYGIEGSVEADALRSGMARYLEACPDLFKPGFSPAPLSDNVLDQHLANFFRKNGAHPMFGPWLDLAGVGQPMPNEVFRFPEFYLARQCLVLGLDRLHAETGMGRHLWTARQYKSSMIGGEQSALQPRGSLCLTPDHQALLEKRFKAAVDPEADVFQDRSCERIRTVIYWYTRESFRYGTHSRRSMFYDRWSLDRLLETAAFGFAMAQAEENPDRKAVWLDRLVQLEGLVDIHASFCSRLGPGQMVAEGYQAALNAWMERFQDAL